ncbi:TorF family putative porin [Endothiovibrio diazotrophicus]
MQHAMKKTALMVALLAGSAVAQAEWSANVALTTDYVWRGYSQSDESPAIQGGIDYNHESGFYVGTWASNVDFGPANDADMEWDLYGGFSGELANGLGYDLGLVYYGYPDSTATESWLEGYLNLSYALTDMVTLNGGLAYSSDVYGMSEDAIYYNAGLDFSLPQDFGLSASVGYYDDDDKVFNNYTDWKLALTKSFNSFDFELGYTDTDVNNDPWADGRVYLMVSKSL